MLVLDVDGVLTDGTIVVDSQGRESKFFSVLDGHGIKMWKRAGLKVAFLSGRESAPTKQQARELAVDFCLEGCIDKYACLLELMQTSGVSAGQIAYIGDDLPDLPVIRVRVFPWRSPTRSMRSNRPPITLPSEKAAKGPSGKLSSIFSKKPADGMDL